MNVMSNETLVCCTQLRHKLLYTIWPQKPILAFNNLTSHLQYGTALPQNNQKCCVLVIKFINKYTFKRKNSYIFISYLCVIYQWNEIFTENIYVLKEAEWQHLHTAWHAYLTHILHPYSQKFIFDYFYSDWNPNQSITLFLYINWVPYMKLVGHMYITY